MGVEKAPGLLANQNNHSATKPTAMTEKQSPENSKPYVLVKDVVLPSLGVVISLVALLASLLQLERNDQTTATYIVIGIGLVFLILSLGWVWLRKTTIIKPAIWPIGATTTTITPYYPGGVRKAALMGLIAITSATIFMSAFFIIRHANQEQKLIVMLAVLDGPEEVYGLRNEIYEKLTADFANDKSIVIIKQKLGRDGEIVTTSSEARKLGKKHQADLVIWGWYLPIEDPNIHFHIENLEPKQWESMQVSEDYQPSVTLAEMETTDFQQHAGQEVSTLISFLVGIIDYQNNHYDDAIENFNRALQSLPEDPYLVQNEAEIYFYRANSHWFSSNHKLALQDYDQAIQLDPQYTFAYNNRGTAYAELGEYQRALQDYDQAIQLDPQYAGAYSNRGNSYAGLEDYLRAIQDFDQAIQLDPQLVTAYNNRGAAYADLDEYQRAIQDYDQAIQLEPQYANAYYNRGLAYAALGKHQRALQDYDQAIQLDPQYAFAYNNRGTAYAELGEYQRALQDFDQAIQLDPQLTLVYYNRGTAYAELGEYQRAIQDFDQAIQLDPQYAAAYNNRGAAYAGLEEYQRAIQDFDQAIQLDPQDAAAYNNRGTAYQQLGKTNKAEADFAQYKKLTGQDAP